MYYNKTAVKTIIRNALNGYNDKPKVTYWNDAVDLDGGYWGARDDVEVALGKRNHVESVQNRPTGKKIYLK